MPTEPIESLLSRLEPQLRRVALGSTCAEVREKAGDLLNDQFLKSLRHPVPSHANPESYTVESFKNLVRDRERACNRRIARDVEFMRTRPAARSDRVDEVAIRHDLRWHIKRALRQANLRPDHRCALWAWLRDSLDEFASRRGITRKTAGVWAWRARELRWPTNGGLNGEPAVGTRKNRRSQGVVPA
jgi:hypothetical protein